MPATRRLVAEQVRELVRCGAAASWAQAGKVPEKHDPHKGVPEGMEGVDVDLMGDSEDDGGDSGPDDGGAGSPPGSGSPGPDGDEDGSDDESDDAPQMMVMDPEEREETAEALAGPWQPARGGLPARPSQAEQQRPPAWSWRHQQRRPPDG